MQPERLFEIVRAVGADIVTRLRGLVVGYILRGYREAVGDVLHQAVDTIVGGYGGDIESQLCRLAVAAEHLLAPVAQQVGLQAGVRLRAVIELGVELL